MVETHLRHVYAKLAISRRTQLASRSDALTP
jgi:DNA-binding CsgD family transcriptional regulator